MRSEVISFPACNKGGSYPMNTVYDTPKLITVMAMNDLSFLKRR